MNPRAFLGLQGLVPSPRPRFSRLVGLQAYGTSAGRSGLREEPWRLFSLFFFPSSFEVYVFPVGTEFTSDVVLLFGTTDTLALLCIYIDVFHFRLLLPYRLLETVEQSPSCWPVCPCRLLFVC